MAEITDDDHLFEDMTPESPGTIGRNITKRLGLASQVAEAIRSPNNNTRKVFRIFFVFKWLTKITTQTALYASWLKVITSMAGYKTVQLIIQVLHNSPSLGYSSEVKIQTKPCEKWGSSHTKHDGGLAYIANYQRELDLTKGLYFDMYRNSPGETYHIEYITVSGETD